MNKKELLADRLEDYREVLERSEEYLAEVAEARLFSDVESRTEPDFNRCY